MRFEREIHDREGPMDQSADIRRQPDGSIDFDFYRRRAIYQRRMAKRIWLKNTLRVLAQFAQGSVASLRVRAAGRSAPVARCCLAVERAVCCA
jgi:hypothetical protein